MAAGIKVVGYDSSLRFGAYNVFVNQADTAGIGKGLADMACDEAPSCTGEIAVLSAAQTATNQNAWIAAIADNPQGRQVRQSRVGCVVYGNDDPTISTTQAQALLTAHPNLQGHRRPDHRRHRCRGSGSSRPRSDRQGLRDGLGTPRDGRLRPRRRVPEFALWNVTDSATSAYVVAVDSRQSEPSRATWATPSATRPSTWRRRTRLVRTASSFSVPRFVFNATNHRSVRGVVRLLAHDPLVTQKPTPARIVGAGVGFFSSVEGLTWNVSRLDETSSRSRGRVPAAPRVLSGPEMIEALKAAGARNYSIYLHGGRSLRSARRRGLRTASGATMDAAPVEHSLAGGD